MTDRRSPDGYFYRFDPNAPAGQRLGRRASADQPWSTGRPEGMSPDELRFVAAVIDEVRLEVVK